MTEIRPYTPQDAITLCKDESKRDLAKFNLSGPSHSLFVDGRLLCCFGIRFGVGEGWFIMDNDDRSGMKGPQFTSDKRTILRACKVKMEDMIRENGLWKLFAEPEMSEVFIRALGFEEQRIFVR